MRVPSRQRSPRAAGGTLVQVRTDPRAKAYIAKHRAAGKSYREAVRALKRRLSDVVWRQLRDDLRGAASPIAERK